MNDLLSGIDESELLGMLPPSVSKALETLEANGLKWDQIGSALAAAPPQGVILKGGQEWRGDFWVAVKAQFKLFLCTDSKEYADLRKEWDGHRKQSTTLAVQSLCGLIGAQVGTLPGIVAPLVIWLMVVGGRMSKLAMCEYLTRSDPPRSS